MSKLFEYEIIYHHLKDLINNDLSQNDKLPSENKLCTKFNSTRSTVRQAIAKLKNEGLIYSKKGSGNFVTPNKIRYELSPTTSFTNEIQKLNKIPASKILDLEMIQADEILAQEFNIDIKSPLLKVSILRYVDDIPFLFTISYLNSSILEDIDKFIKEYESLTQLFVDEYSIQTVRNHSEIDIIGANPYISEKLNMQSHMPLIKISSSSIDKKTSQVIEYCESYFRSDMAKIVIDYTGEK
ncbi:MAG: GntR family transcriptional regulator [Campylobacterota bacterium]|nr:GntR family transcriptional regulator [Campylobacterota bacterium]